MKNRYKVSEAFKESCKANIGLNRYGRIHVVEDDIDIVGENYDGQLINFTIEDNCYTKDTFIGTTEAKKITVNILNSDDEIDIEDKTIEVYVGIEIDGQLEEIPYGTYIIEKPDNKEIHKKTSFTGYDYMIKFNVPYVHDDTIIYPIKMSELLIKLCKQVGLELGNTDFPNANYMVLGNPFTNEEDCRTVLSNIAQLAGGFAKIGRDNKVYIKTLDNSVSNLLRVKDVHNMPIKDLHIFPIKRLASLEETLDAHTHEELSGNTYLEDFTKNKQWGELNSLVLSLQNDDIQGENTAMVDEESIAEFGLTEIRIENHPFLINEAEREKAIVELWERLKKLKYLPFNTSYYGFPYLDSGDFICLYDSKDIYYTSYVFNHKFTYNGAFSGSIGASAMTKTQTKYKNTQNIQSKFKRVERSVDKINGKIEDIVEQQTEVGEKLSKHEQTIDSIRDEVSSVETKLENDYSTTVEMNSLIEQKADSITSSVTSSVTTSMNNKLNNYYTISQTDSKISQTASSITSEVNKKVSNSEFGTKIQQSATDIQIAWNKISSYIQFIDASLRIMDSSSRKLLQLDRYGLYLYDTDGSTNKMILNRTGQQFYEGGEYVGFIGTNRLNGYEDKKSLSFNLDTRGSYMTWACKDNSGDSLYDMKLWYARPNTGNLHQGLCLGTDLYLNGYNICLQSGSESAKFVEWTNNNVGIRSTTRFAITDGNNETYFAANVPGGENQFFRNVNMNGHNIYNAANVASDGRLKKNIYSSKINALDRTMQMKIRDFNWKKDNKEDFGFIAQELEEIDERYVQHNYKEDEEGNVTEDSYELRHTPLIATNTKAIQELKEIIDTQQKQINMLMQKLNIQQDIPSKKEIFIEEPETIFEGEVVMETSKVLTPAPRYNTVMKYLDDNTVDIYQELAEDSEV